MSFDRGTFWVLPLTYFYIPRSSGAHLFSTIRQQSITFAAAPLVLTPFVRNQGTQTQNDDNNNNNDDDSNSNDINNSK